MKVNGMRVLLVLYRKRVATLVISSKRDYLILENDAGSNPLATNWSNIFRQ
jgi:hypothetical protein